MREINKTLVLRSHFSELTKLEEFIEMISDEYNIGHTYFSNIIVSLTELVRNAIIHGNKNQTNQTVDIIFLNQDGKLVFTVKDKGTGFSFPLPDTKNLFGNPNINNGLTIVSSLSDGLEFKHNGSEITVYFDIAAANELLSKSRMNVFSVSQKVKNNKKTLHE
jgi:serine/threonine-protein kinase RsbW